MNPLKRAGQCRESSWKGGQLLHNRFSTLKGDLPLCPSPHPSPPTTSLYSTSFLDHCWPQRRKTPHRAWQVIERLLSHTAERCLPSQLETRTLEDPCSHSSAVTPQPPKVKDPLWCYSDRFIENVKMGCPWKQNQRQIGEEQAYGLRNERCCKRQISLKVTPLLSDQHWGKWSNQGCDWLKS